MADMPGKRKRVSETKTTMTELDTVLFMCSIRKPWKARLTLPCASKISVEEVRQALTTCGAAVPCFPRGKFHVIANNDIFQVALFEFQDTAGCRSTSSKQHDRLPRPWVSHRDIAQEPTVKVGYKFFYGTNIEYKVVAKEVHLMPTAIASAPTQVTTTEGEKTAGLHVQVTNAFPNYEVCMPTPLHTGSFCPFTGGGDLEIFCGTSAAVVEVAETMVEENEAGEEATAVTITPPKRGEQQSAVLEHKGDRGQQKPEEVTSQLQADMIVTCVKLLQKIIQASVDAAPEVTCLTVYGVQIGISYPVKLLKVTTDFDTETLCFQELFASPVYPSGGAYVDMSLQDIFQALDQQQ